MLPLRRPDGEDGLVLHLPRLRDEHGLQLTRSRIVLDESRGDAALDIRPPIAERSNCAGHRGSYSTTTIGSLTPRHAIGNSEASADSTF